MIPAWYQRMNPRERLLSWIVAGTLFTLFNLWVFSSVLGAVGSAVDPAGGKRLGIEYDTVSLQQKRSFFAPSPILVGELVGGNDPASGVSK